MKLESVGILISLRPFGERDSIARVFSYDFGLMSGLMRGAVVAKKNKPLVGQVGAVSWNARLDSQLGAFHWDATRNMAAPLMMRADTLGLMNAAFALLDALLPEREQNAALYNATIEMLGAMAVGGDVREHYLQWEMELLRDLGYALDFSRCSGCGARENLNWISPRTGRAVCDDCAAPYKTRLYRMPADLHTTFEFISRACAAQGADVPTARRMICNI